MTKTEMCNAIIKRLGFEHKATIFFIQLCEDYPNADDYKMYEVFYALINLA